MEHLIRNYSVWILPASVILAVALLVVVVRWLFFRIARAAASRTGNHFMASLTRREKSPTGTLLFALLVLILLPALPFSKDAQPIIHRLSAIGLISAFVWMVIGLIRATTDMLLHKYRASVTSDLEYRRVQTQIVVLRRIFTVFLVLIGLGLVLMTFPTIRALGTGLFASAGIAGLALGLAAKPMLSNLIAGVQIALSQPVRLGDIVVVEGESGTIEEITTTFVIVRTWDLRRLVIPLTHFIEKPFENWTRTNPNLLGAVTLFTDYNVPVEDLRQELKRILDSSPLWDGKAWGLEVVNATERGVELRALLSSADSDRSWSLRCLVRERMIQFLQQRCPQALPKTRTEVLPARQ